MLSTDSEGSANRKSVEHEQNSKKRSAGFWSVFFMVIGVQFGGLSTVWNVGATEGLKKLFLGHALVGLMYVLLAVCFAELTSVVPFAGGSFGFCRAALGPFWGFMVGASEVLENIMKVVVCVFLIALSSSSIFETKESLQLVWIFLCYLSLFAIHLRGGAVFWAAVIILGLISIGTVLMFCIGNTKDIDVKLYGQIENSSFEGRGDEFLGSLYLLIWVYIGLEIVPQTCERVKNVHKNLPRALVLGTMLTYGFIFWVIVAVVCNAPGYLYPAAWLRNPYPFSIGFVMMFDTPKFLVYGPLFAIIPLFASALTFMWGCGYQVASLARSGLLPSVFAKTYGENETPVVALGVSTLVQFLMCVAIQRTNLQRGLKTCYTTMMIGATFVYIGMFASFIVFRVRFGGMKRHWVSPVGIPGALVGMGMAIILCIAVIVLNPYNKATTTYFVFMGVATLYYVLYARYTQYFSKEEQQQFLKAYILNANKAKSKQKTLQQKVMEAMFAPINRIFSLPASMFSKSHHTPSSASMISSASKHSRQSSSTKHNAVAPAPAATLSTPTDPDRPSKADDEVRMQEPSRGATIDSIPSSASVASTAMVPTATNPRGAPLRASWAAASGSTKVSWSGKAMTMTESKKFLEVLMSAPEDVANQLVESLPNQFVSLGVDEAAIASVVVDAMGAEGKRGDESEDREVLLGEIVEGALEDEEGV